MDTLALDNKKGNIFSLVKGVFVATLVSVFSILIFALAIKFLDIPGGYIQPVNQVIKFLSILLGTKSMFKISKSKNLLLSVLLGIIYTALAIMIFNLLSGNFSLDTTILTDSLFGGIAGLISGVIVKIIK